ncbi:MAG: WG repeat-containing protein, partial [Micromonosporaceae bacterium]
EDPTPLELIQEGLTRKLGASLTDASRTRLYGLRAVTSRLLGRLKEALDDAERSLVHAKATGSARKVAVAQTRLARVLQWRGDHLVADELYQRALDASVPDRLRAAIHHHAGASCLDQGRFLEAINHFEKALALRPDEDAEQLAVTDRAFNAISRRAEESGFGPFSRTRAEILQEPAPPRLRFHKVLRRYGFTDPSGTVAIPPTYQKAYPFSDGLAWVQPEDSSMWSSIDITGRPVISATDYQGVSPYSEGLSWVMTDPVVGWFAIDAGGMVVVSPAGYTDVRPFQAGMAAVQRSGRWGAVDRDGRELISMEYDGFRTARSDAVYQAGFTSEGLAVVKLEDRMGVINHNGEVMVPIKYGQVEIHPLAYLVKPPYAEQDYTNPFRTSVDLADGWGALDRSGKPIVETIHMNRAEVLEELEKMLRDARPIL